LIGEYDFLKPLSGETILDSTTESNFIMTFNNATKEEFEYYIKNNKLPYGLIL
jgi:hypothetical protein